MRNGNQARNGGKGSGKVAPGWLARLVARRRAARRPADDAADHGTSYGLELSLKPRPLPPPARRGFARLLPRRRLS